ncbi:MAG: tagatose 1,6-diphosphate aldolase [Anaerolineae bacterium]
MTQSLTPGRWRGLKATSTRNNIFSILAFDQRGTYRRMLPEGTSYEDAAQIKRDIVVALSFHASAVLLDNQYGLKSVNDMNGGSGVLMSYEESGYSGDSTYRGIKFEDDWTIAKIRNMGASAVKILAYYNPQSGALAEEIEGVLRSVADECHKYDMPLFLEPLSYSLDANVAKESAEFAKIRPQLVIDTAERLSKTGADILKMESPVDPNFNSDQKQWADTFAAVSKASTVPWVLLSAGVDFSTFAEQTKLACQDGASGWLAGRAIWKEAVTMTSAERDAFLKGEAANRIQSLVDIATATARPWSDFYTAPESSLTWYKSYNLQ